MFIFVSSALEAGHKNSQFRVENEILATYCRDGAGPHPADGQGAV
jgi:hypothetical protein